MSSILLKRCTLIIPVLCWVVAVHAQTKVTLGLSTDSLRGTSQSSINQSQTAVSDLSADLIAIKQLIAAETDAFYRHDYAAWANCWAHDSTVSWAYVTAPGRTVRRIGWPSIERFHATNFLPTKLKLSFSFTRDEYQVHVSGDSAVASFVAHQSGLVGERTSNETRVLCRQGNGWKMVSLKATEEPRAYLLQLGFQLIPISALFVLALLHAALYLLDRRKRSNLYFCLFMTDLALVLTLRYIDMSGLRFSTQLSALSIVSITLIPITASVFVYSICGQKQPWWVRWMLMGGACLLLGWAYWPWRLPLYFVQVFDIFAVLVALDFSRVIGQAMLRRQPGIGLIGIGLLLTIVLCVDLTLNFLGLQANNGVILTTLVLYMGLLAVPLSSSIYLAREFVRNNLNLEAQSAQVARLSEQMLAQEQEKARLLAEQNEQLEQQVQTRTQEIQVQNHQLAEQKTAIEQQAQALTELDELKTRFFTNLTHEFRTPLTLILGPAEQLAQLPEPTPRRQAQLIRQNAQRLLNLINQLLDLSKLEAGKMALTVTAADVVALTRSVVRSFEPLAVQKQIGLDVVTNVERFVAQIDPDKLEKIVSNLLSNAVKFTPAEGYVTVRLDVVGQADTTELHLTVTDTGVGVASDQLPHLFDRFYQADASTTRPYEGSGIGLALTKELVNLYDGRIQLQSQPGQGTTVTVQLPIQPICPQTARLSLPADLPHAIDSVPLIINADVAQADAPVVLLIEDNTEMRQYIRSLIGPTYQVLEAANGQAGVALAYEHIPDLILTDVMMPELNGYGLCRLLKDDQRTSHIPIVMLTAKAGLDSRVEGLETGADAYVAKPFDSRELLVQINNLIQLRQRLRERYAHQEPGAPDPTLPSMEQAFLHRVRAVIEQYVDDPTFSVETLGREIGMSRMQLHRKLKALIDQAPGDYIRLLRLQRALFLLEGNVATVSEVAYQVGFSDPANFSTSFSRHFGFPPSQVKRKPALVL